MSMPPNSSSKVYAVGGTGGGYIRRVGDSDSANPEKADKQKVKSKKATDDELHATNVNSPDAGYGPLGLVENSSNVTSADGTVIFPSNVSLWTVDHVAEWIGSVLTQNEKAGAKDGEAVRATVIKENIDGAVLTCFDDEGWKELGINSAIQRARLKAGLNAVGSGRGWSGGKSTEKPDNAATTASDAGPQGEATETKSAAPDNGPDSPSLTDTPDAAVIRATGKDTRSASTWEKLGQRAETITFRHGGAGEHMVFWHSAVSHANAHGGNTKRHILNFLGMYNVLALLMFTVCFSELARMGIGSSGGDGGAKTTGNSAYIKDIWDLVFYILFGLSAAMSAMGINATAIAFNTSSACHDNNATALFKTPGMCKYLKQCNDTCLFGCIPATFGVLVLFAKIGIKPFVDRFGDYDDGRDSDSPSVTSSPTSGPPSTVSDELIIASFVISIVLLVFFGFYGSGNAAAAPATTMVFFAGLMQDEAVAPPDWKAQNPGADPALWALNTDGTEIEKYLTGRAMERMNIEDEAEMLRVTYTDYGKNAVQHFLKGLMKKRGGNVGGGFGWSGFGGGGNNNVENRNSAVSVVGSDGGLASRRRNVVPLMQYR